jgi:hypothetical protein
VYLPRQLSRVTGLQIREEESDAQRLSESFKGIDVRPPTFKALGEVYELVSSFTWTKLLYVYLLGDVSSPRLTISDLSIIALSL